jgi:uncharacterized protein
MISIKSNHILKALLHLPGFGPKKIESLRTRGISTWDELIGTQACDLPGFESDPPDWINAIKKCQHAASSGDLLHLINTLHRSDQWRILADCLEHATYLDIETSGDQQCPEITLIICKHRGSLHTFTAERNLNKFIELLDEIDLLVTFNGASFDVPQIENHFRIPLGHIPHIDLRWVCYHAQLRGGLKKVENAIGLIRPPDLIGMDGAEADWLWRRYKETGNVALLHRLTRYCAADVIGLEFLSQWLIAKYTGESFPDFQWTELPAP